MSKKITIASRNVGSKTFSKDSLAVPQFFTSEIDFTAEVICYPMYNSAAMFFVKDGADVFQATIHEIHSRKNIKKGVIGALKKYHSHLKNTLTSSKKSDTVLP